LDVSSSVDEQEYKLQRNGLAAALNSQDIRWALLNGGRGYVSLAAFEWSGRNQQKLVLNWTKISGHADIDHIVAGLLKTERSYDKFPTAMGWSLGYAASVLQDAPPCTRQVMDVSGDGINNDGFSPRLAYRHFPLADVTVNGLVVLSEDPAVADFYHREVLKGPTAFLEQSQGYEGYETAMTRKLFREISDLMLGQAEITTDKPG
jgi:hypothetical protein